MDVIHFIPGRPPVSVPVPAAAPERGWLWLDIHDEAGTWPQLVQRLAGVAIHEGHLRDCRNSAHPSFYDATADYEMLIFRALATEPDDARIATRPAVFFLMERMLVTVRSPESRSVRSVKERMTGPMARHVDSPQELMHLILTTIVDRFLALRENLSEQMERWADKLLEPDSGFDEWKKVLAFRSRVRRLLIVSEGQEDAVVAWRSNTRFEPDEHVAVRYRDLLEHIRRVTGFADEQENEIESLLQLHYSSISHRTNEIVRVLTVVSAIFLPLTLISGIFGMNFSAMPGLEWRFGYFVTLGGMLFIAAVLLIIFRVKRWI